MIDRGWRGAGLAALVSLGMMTLASCERPKANEATKVTEAKDESRAAQLEAVKDKLGIQVSSDLKQGGEFMCSADLKTHPVSELHVVPTYNASLGKFVGGYRCDADWKAAIAEARAHLHGLSRDALLDQLPDFLQVFLNRGVTEEQLRGFVAGKAPLQAADAALDALAAEQLKLTL